MFTRDERVPCPCPTCLCLLSYVALPVPARVWAPGTKHTSCSPCVLVRGAPVLLRRRAVIPCFVPLCWPTLALRVLSGSLCACCVPRFPSALMAHREGQEGGSQGASLVDGRVGVAAHLCLPQQRSSFCTYVFLVHSWSFHPSAVGGGGLGLVLPHQTLHCLSYHAWAYHLVFFLCPRARGMCVLWRCCTLRWDVAPSSRLPVGAPHTITSCRLDCSLVFPHTTHAPFSCVGGLLLL